MGSRETYPKWKVCEGGSQSRGVSVKWVIHTTVWAIHTDRAGVAEVRRGQGEIWMGGRDAGKIGVGSEKAGIRTEIADLSEVTGGHLRGGHARGGQLTWAIENSIYRLTIELQYYFRRHIPPFFLNPLTHLPLRVYPWTLGFRTE